MGLLGSISRTLFGGSKSKTDNRFANQLNSQFSPFVSQGAGGMGMMAGILGLNGAPAQDAALDGWWKGSGGDFLLSQGMDQIMGNRAAGGLLRSGGTSKAIEDYRSGLASTKLGEVMGYANDMAKNAIGAGSLIADAGKRSKATESSGGLGKFLGALFASDARLKTNVEKVGELADGLGVYEWDYLPIEGRIAEYMPEGRQRGVMADEVAQLRPWALGPVIDGYATVNYNALEAA